ncbi:hypothetical protein AB833_03560 [Chromatiales bacterium (ex Bugula neritina AB1)]|nr:hypothetical protein AB833_03560 [Chromatiales bacterium (ex Bugula neritina AB1)]
MRLLKRIVGFILLLVVVLAIIGMLLPREVSVARSIDISASADKIFPHFNNLEKTIAWSPWLHHDPHTKNTFNDIPEGVGAVMEWHSDHQKVGSGRMEITDSIPDESIAVALDFGDMGSATAAWNLEPAGDETTATWSMTTDMGADPVGRLFGVMMKKWIAADYDQGLKNLKELVESE